jgi:hypothetical protein
VAVLELARAADADRATASRYVDDRETTRLINGGKRLLVVSRMHASGSRWAVAVIPPDLREPVPLRGSRM